jgi:hypothetical protein
MPVAIPGLEALFKHQFGRQEDLGIANTASRVYPFTGRADINLNWTDAEGDQGSLDPITPPTRGTADHTANLTDPKVFYNDLPLILGSILGGDVEPTGGGASKTWVYTPTSLTAGEIDLYTYEFGNDVLTDWFQAFDGLTESVTFTFPRGLEAVSASMNWRFGEARYEDATEATLQPDNTVPTSGLTLNSTDIPVYMAHAALYIDSAAGSLGATQISDALYGGQLTISRELDTKRFVNGTGFGISGYSSGKRNVELSLDFAQTADTVGAGSETDAWFSETAVNRFVRLAFTSTAEASVGVPYSWVINIPLRYKTRAWDAEGGNTVINLTGNQFYDTTLTYAISSTVVNTLTLGGLETGLS